MAIKKTIEIDVDQVQAMGGLDALQKELEQTETVSLSLKKELKLLKEQLATLPQGSEEYNKISKRAGEVSDKIGDINQRIKTLGSDTHQIDRVVQGTQALSGAFSVASGASALLGENSEDLQKSMAKVESAIALTVGVQSVANALQKDTALSIGLTTAATNIQSAAQVAYTAVVGATTGALKALKIALISTGVGALVVGLGLLVSALASSKEATETEEEAIKRLTEANKRYEESLQSELKSLDYANKAQVLRAKILGQSETDIRKITAQGEAEKAQYFKNEESRLDKELQNNKLTAKEYKLLLDQRNKIADEALAFSQERTLNDLEFEQGIADKKREDQKKAGEEAKKKAKELADELLRISKEKYDAEQAFLKKQNDSELAQFDETTKAIEEAEKSKADFQKTNQQIEIDAVDAKYTKLLDFATQHNLDTTALTEEQQNAINDINLKYQQVQYDNDQKALNDKKILHEQEIALTSQTLGKVSELLGKNTKAGKAFAVAQALFNTYQGITAELSTKAITPYEIGLKVANVAFVAATGFKAVKQILSTSDKGGSASSGGGFSGGGGSNSTPQFNLVGQSSTNQLTSTIAGQQNQPIQTYVVGSQVTNQQALDRNAQQTSSF